MSRRSRPFLSTALVAVGLFAPAAASAEPDVLSSRLDMLAGKDLRNASRAEQADAISWVKGGPGSILRDGDSLVVEIRVSSDARGMVEAVEAAGVDRIAVAPEYDLIEASVPEGKLRDLAGVPGVES